MNEAMSAVERLREALQPLVEKADWADRQKQIWGRDWHDGRTVSISLGTCRRVREALATPSLPDGDVERVLDVVDELYRKYGVELDAEDTAIVQQARDALARDAAPVIDTLGRE